MTRLGPYEVLDELGRGGMGVVYRARDPDGREVAVKLLARSLAKPGALERFQRETRLQARLGEADGFVPLLDAGEAPEGLYLVMPLLPGGSLRARIEAGPLSIDDAVALTRTIATAVGRAHAQGIVHRDLKPENVLFTADGKPLVSDLGLAKHFRHDVSGASQSVALSKTGEVRGTVGYMAPEQLADATRAGPPADVFALGTILYELLAGAPPFEGGSVIELLARTESGSYERLAKRRKGTPAWLDSLVARALKRDPAQRFADGAELARALEAGAPARGLAPVVAIAGAVTVALVLVAGALVMAHRAEPAAPARKEPPPIAAKPVEARAALSPELLAAARRFDAPSLERAARLARGNAVDSELDRALAEGLAAARKRSWASATEGLAALERSGLAHGDPFSAAALALVAEGSHELLEKHEVEPAIRLLDVAGRLRLRHARAQDAYALLDEFYRREVSGEPILPHERWHEVLLACLRLDIEFDTSPLDLATPTFAPSRKPDAFEKYLEARLSSRYAGTDDAWQAYTVKCGELSKAPELGPRIRALMLAEFAWTKTSLDDRLPILKQAIELDLESPRRRDDLAVILEKAGRFREAIEAERTAIEVGKALKPTPLMYHQFESDAQKRITNWTALLAKTGSEPPPGLAPEVLAASRRFDRPSLERAGRLHGARAPDPELDRALAEGLSAARSRSWASATEGLAALERSGLGHGDAFAAAALALVAQGSHELLEKHEVESAIHLLDAAGRLRLRHAHGRDGYLLLDEFYHREISDSPILPHERWHEVLLPLIRIDVEMDAPVLDVATPTFPASRKPDVFERFLAGRLEAHYHGFQFGGTDASPEFDALCGQLRDAPELGPRLRALMLRTYALSLPTEERLALVRRSVELDPECPLRHRDLAVDLENAGMLRESIEAERRGIEVWRALEPTPLMYQQFEAEAEGRIRKRNALLAETPGGR
jgi:hypothetical protein